MSRHRRLRILSLPVLALRALAVALAQVLAQEADPELDATTTHSLVRSLHFHHQSPGPDPSKLQPTIPHTLTLTPNRVVVLVLRILTVIGDQ